MNGARRGPWAGAAQIFALLLVLLLSAAAAGAGGDPTASSVPAVRAVTTTEAFAHFALVPPVRPAASRFQGLFFREATRCIFLRGAQGRHPGDSGCAAPRGRRNVLEFEFRLFGK
jgi:hypothetical protein